MIEISKEQINRVNLILSDVQKGPQRVFYQTVNRALTNFKSTVIKGVSEIYTIKQSDLRKEVKTKRKKATVNNLLGSIEFGGNLIEIKKFDITPNTNGHKVQVEVKKGKKYTLEHAYQTDLGKYGTAIFERLTRERNTSQEIYGPSAATMISNAAVIKKAEEKAQETINKRIEQEITRILNKY
ncbi:MAG: hypothetical protein LKJ25_06115 [Clostridia bacterium]|jgi:hypothetical protein|nr:hypothetical protein [Clostridia bacterium]